MRFKCSLFAVCFLFFLGCKEISKKTEQKKSTTIPLEKNEPKSTFEDLEGKPIELLDYKGKKILLNYWATWCRPCIEEMPALLSLQSIMEKENYIFLFASDQSLDKIKTFKTTKKFDFNFLKFNRSYSEQQITALPVTLIYNEVGEQVARFDGGELWNTPEMIQKLKEL